MKIAKKTLSLGLLMALGLYAGSFMAIKVTKPRALTTNDGPGRIYCIAYLPLRFLAASSEQGYWRDFTQRHWHAVRYIGFNSGNGYLDIEGLDGSQGRAWSGRDIDGAKEGEIWQIHYVHDLQTWDDFSDHLIGRVDATRKPNQSSQPTRSARG